jgi:uncharacterized protein YifN (PemK superfamily)
MPLKFQPKGRAVVMCDFRGFVAPEMVKTRPVVVIKQHKRNRNLVTVVPLSTTEPTYLEDFHHELERSPLPKAPPGTRVWAKCDMIYTVSLSRLDRYKVGREYFDLTISPEQFSVIQEAVRKALGFHVDLPLPKEAPPHADHKLVAIEQKVA